jgi:hypothetical protein
LSARSTQLFDLIDHGRGNTSASLICLRRSGTTAKRLPATALSEAELTVRECHTPLPSHGFHLRLTLSFDLTPSSTREEIKRRMGWGRADGNCVMPQQESYINRAEKLPPNLLSPEIATMGKQCIEELVNVQTELLERLQETNRHWLERVQSEAALASKYATKLTATRSVSEAMTTCQEWTSRQIEMIAEDSKLLVADTQRFMETGARLLWNDWWSNRPDGLPGLRTGT